MPISLHVDYWDYIGWKEPFAQPRFSERQSWLVHANGHKTVVHAAFLSSPGRKFATGTADLDDELKRVIAQPARADIQRPRRSQRSWNAFRHSVRHRPTLPREPRPVCRAHRGQTYLERFGGRKPRRHVVARSRRARMDRTHCIERRSRRCHAGRAHASSSWNSAQFGIAAFVQDLRTGAGAPSCRSIPMSAVVTCTRNRLSAPTGSVEAE